VSRDDPTSIKLLAKTRMRTLCAFFWGVLRTQQLVKGNLRLEIFQNQAGIERKTKSAPNELEMPRSLWNYQSLTAIHISRLLRQDC
jgi:phage gp37-like protein